jgi:hypothetical protein
MKRLRDAALFVLLALFACPVPRARQQHGQDKQHHRKVEDG